MFYYSNEEVTNTEVSTREWATVVTNLTMLGLGGMGKTLGLWTRKAVESCKQSLMDHDSWILDNSSIDNHVDCGGSTQEISEGEDISN